jgi:hypothetical protein
MKILRLIGLIVFSLWVLAHVIQDVLSVGQVSDFLFDYLVWRHESISDLLAVAIGLGLVVLGTVVIGHELSGKQTRNWLARPAAVCATVGVLLALSVAYQPVPINLTNRPVGVGEAHALGGGGQGGSPKAPGKGGGGGSADPSDEGTLQVDGSSSGSVPSQAFKSEVPAGESCGCPLGPSSPSYEVHKESSGSVREYQLREESEPEPVEDFEYEPEFDEPDWSEPEEPEWEEEW